jgi:transposase
MIFVGMDVHSKTTTFCFFDPSLPEDRRSCWVTCETTAAAITAQLAPLQKHCKVAFEVGTQAQWVAGVVRPLAGEVQVANSSRIPWLFRSGKKNDRLDAQKLAILLHMDQLPKVHLPSSEVSAWRSLINYRRSQVQQRTATKARIRAIVRSQGLRYPKRNLWTKAGLKWLDAQVMDSILRLMVQSLLADLKSKEQQIAIIEAQLYQIARSHPGIYALRTIPGIGPRTAEAVVAFADDIRRFARGRQFASYFGLTPTEDSSAEVIRHGHISKRGPSVVRWVLAEATHQVVRRSPVFAMFFARIHRGQKDRKKKAIVATARKLLMVMFGMLRDGTVFEPSRVTREAA